jgi:hypothetical protein
MNALGQKLRALLVLGVVAVVVVAVVRWWGGGFERSLVYEGTEVVFPGTAPDAKTYREAMRRPDKAVLLIRWVSLPPPAPPGRYFDVRWYVVGKIDEELRVREWSQKNRITTFSVVVDVVKGDVVGIEGIPPPNLREGWSECMVFHRNEKIEPTRSERGSVACAVEMD